MAQKHVWEQEYEKKLLVGGVKPAASFRTFCKWLKKERKKSGVIPKDLDGFVFSGLRVLDLGSGEGKNALYMAERGAEVVGIEIARNAIEAAQRAASEVEKELRIARGSLEYQQGSIGEELPFPEESFDIVLDVTSTNSLSAEEREVSLRETSRVLKSGGYLFLRTLCKDGDENAKNLIKQFPGSDPDTYTMPDLGLTERVFTETDLRALYGQYFEIIKLEKEFHYTKFQGQSYKRAFWIGYFQK